MITINYLTTICKQSSLKNYYYKQLKLNISLINRWHDLDEGGVLLGKELLQTKVAGSLLTLGGCSISE